MVIPLVRLRGSPRDIDTGADQVRAAYPPAICDPLASVKRRYDPDNNFRLNQDIPPAIE